MGDKTYSKSNDRFWKSCSIIIETNLRSIFMSTLLVEAKLVGQRRPIFSGWRIDLPERRGDHLKLRDLITRVVLEEVEAFQKRQQERRLARVLSAAEIEAGRIKGKIDSGERDLQQNVDPDVAVGTALQAFEDGLYYVFIDGDQQTDLDREVFLQPESQVTFLRLVALAGG
jgi:hypothetical protein